MRLETRKLLDKAFSGLGLIAIAVMGLALLLILTPIVWRGSKAFIFKGTIEHRRVMIEQFDRGNPDKFTHDLKQSTEARAPIYQMMADFEVETVTLLSSLESEMESKKAQAKELKRAARALKKEGQTHQAELLEIEEECLKDEAKALRTELQEMNVARTEPYDAVHEAIRELLGPMPGQRKPVLLRQQYGQTRWDRTLVKLHEALYSEEWDYSNPDVMGVLVETPRVEQFLDTKLEPLFFYLEHHIEEMMRPKMTFYWQFITDKSKDSHIFGGIWPGKCLEPSI